jgi:hypothetical protein
MKTGADTRKAVSLSAKHICFLALIFPHCILRPSLNFNEHGVVLTGSFIKKAPRAGETVTAGQGAPGWGARSAPRAATRGPAGMFPIRAGCARP